MISSSGTRSPASMKAFASVPSAVPSLTCARSMSPVARYGRSKSRRRRSAWVPLPAPGGPMRMRFSSAMKGENLLQEAFVVPHHELRLELLHGVERHADHDEDRRAAEEEVGRRLVDEDRREGGHRGEVEGAREREAREDAVQELRGRAAGPH